MVDMACQLVGMASRLVRLARSLRRPWLDPDTWIATSAERKAIGEPLARIATRRAPVSAMASSDVVDGLTAILATGDYGLRNLDDERAATERAAAYVAQLPDAGAAFDPAGSGPVVEIDAELPTTTAAPASDIARRLMK